VSGRSRATLVAELTGIRDPRACPLFVYLVRHLNGAKHAPVYLASIEALGTFGDPDSVDALKQALHRGDWWAPVRTQRARTAAAAALRKIGSAPALDVLRDASAAGSRGTRAAARAQLDQIS